MIDDQVVSSIEFNNLCRVLKEVITSNGNQRILIGQ